MTLTISAICILALVNCRAFETFGVKWDVSEGAIKYSLSKGKLTRKEQAMVLESVKYAMNTWSSACSGGFKFEEGKGNIEVQFVKKNWTYDALYLGYTTFETQGTTIVSAKIIINAQYFKWHRGGATGVTLPLFRRKGVGNLDTLVLHEMGHALGLNHPDVNPAFVFAINDPPTMLSLLYPAAIDLNEDDIKGINSLY